MCGKFVLTDLASVSETFEIEEGAHRLQRSDVCVPGRDIAAVINDGVRRLVLLQWGLIPRWAKDRAMGRKLFNARAETLLDKPSFRHAFKNRRCLVIATGFYEWQKIGRLKKPLLLRLKSHRPFGLAGLYESWTSSEGSVINSCTVITTEPNDLIKPIHDRMPVIIPQEKHALWLNHDTPQKRLRTLLISYPSEEMEIAEPADEEYPVPCLGGLT